MVPGSSSVAVLAALAHFAPGLPAVAAAQDPPPASAAVCVRFVGAADGLPRPGVVVHQRGAGDLRAIVSADGFVRVEDDRVRRLRLAVRAWRSDPAGEIVLPRSVYEQRSRLFAAEPFTLGAPAAAADGVVNWPVLEREPVGVRVLDPDGAPLARFPVALRSGGEDVSVALTDAEGRALLGMPAEHSARIWLLPAGWVGPLDAMPTIAAALAGRRGTELRVPVHGAVRVRALRGGAPVRTRLAALTVYLRGQYDTVWSQPVRQEIEAFGFELPYVAPGVALEGSVGLPRSWPFAGAGPARGGEHATIDVDLPWQPEVRFGVAGPELVFPRGRVQLRFVTDAGTCETWASLGPDDSWRLGGGPSLRGSRLLRVDLDAVTEVAGGAAPVCWTASLPLDRVLSAGPLDLGTVTLAPAPAPHGRVVGADGQPVADVEVVVGRADGERAFLLRTDAEGRFGWRMPLPRDASGALLPLVATARTAALRSATVEADRDGRAIELRLVEPVAPRPRARQRSAGSLVTTIVGAPAQLAGQRWMLRGDHGFGARPASVRARDDAVELRFERLLAGSYTLVVGDREFQTRIVCTGLEVPGDGPCVDPRLERLSPGDEPRVLTVRVVDEQGVPIAGVRATVPGVILTTDGNGLLRIATHDPAPLRAAFERTGWRSRELAALRDGVDVVLQPARTFRVAITGLPADVPPERLEVWVRHEQRERFLGPRGALDRHGAAELELPRAGRYFVNLLWQLRDRPGSATLVAIRAEPLELGEDHAELPPITWSLDDATRARLRELAR